MLYTTIDTLVIPDIHEEDAPIAPDPKEYAQIIMYGDGLERRELISEGMIAESGVIVLLQEKCNRFLRQNLIGQRKTTKVDGVFSRIFERGFSHVLIYLSRSRHDRSVQILY